MYFSFLDICVNIRIIFLCVGGVIMPQHYFEIQSRVYWKGYVGLINPFKRFLFEFFLAIDC